MHKFKIVTATINISQGRRKLHNHKVEQSIMLCGSTNIHCSSHLPKSILPSQGEQAIVIILYKSRGFQVRYHLFVSLFRVMMRSLILISIVLYCADAFSGQFNVFLFTGTLFILCLKVSYQVVENNMRLYLYSLFILCYIFFLSSADGYYYV